MPPRIGSPDHRCRNHLLVKHDGERQTDIARRGLAEALTALGIKSEADNRFIWCAGHNRPCASTRFFRPRPETVRSIKIGNRRIIGRVKHLGIRRRERPSIASWIGIDEIDHPERELGGLIEKAFQTFRIGKARNLDQDPVDTLALDHRLGGSEFVDTLAHHLDRLRHRRGDPVGDAVVGQENAQQTGLWLLDARLVAPVPPPNKPELTGKVSSSSAALASSIWASSRIRTCTTWPVPESPV